MALATRFKVGQHFADVLALCRKLSRAFGVFRIVTKQVTVFLHVGAAAGGVSDDRFHVGLLENVNRFPGEFNSGGFFSCVHEQRAAAGLRFWSDNFASFGGENAHRSRIDLREKLALNTAKEQAHAAALQAEGGRDFWNNFLRSEFGEQRFHRLPFLWKQLGQAQAANEGLQSRLLIREERRAQSTQAIRPRESLEQEMAVAFFGCQARKIAFNLRTRSFDELAVIHSGRARGHAGHAAEAGVEVADPLGSHLRGAFGGQLHQIDATARRIHFLPPQNVSGTRGQTKTAVDALVNDGRGGWMVRVERGRKRIGRRRHVKRRQLQSTVGGGSSREESAG